MFIRSMLHTKQVMTWRASCLTFVCLQECYPIRCHLFSQEGIDEQSVFTQRIIFMEKKLSSFCLMFHIQCRYGNIAFGLGVLGYTNHFLSVFVQIKTVQCTLFSFCCWSYRKNSGPVKMPSYIHVQVPAVWWICYPNTRPGKCCRIVIY